MRINLEDDERLAQLKENRNQLRQLEEPTREQRQELESVEAAYRDAKARNLAERDRKLEEIRTIRDNLGDDVVAHLGGVPMIASDMIDYVKRDVVTFGALVVTLISIMLWVIFRRIRWVVMPLISTGVTVYLTMGLLGFMNQPTTVISSNFISLLAIITISFSIHLIVRYREIRAENPDLRHVDLVFQAMRDKLAPCVYTALTTIVAFSSLVTSDIVPVMDFGWIMSLGIMVSFFVTYSFFAGMLLLLPKGSARVTLYHQPRLTRFLGYLSTRHTTLVLVAAAASYVIAGIEAELAADPKARVAGYEANGGFLTGFDIQDGPRKTLSALMTRDAVLPILCTLASIATHGPLRAQVEALPPRATAADRISGLPTERSSALIATLTQDTAARDALFDMPAAVTSVDQTDGLRVTFDNGEIVHLRPSGNAPELRCYAEAATRARASELVQRTLCAISSAQIG